jgi:cytosine deaminase
VPTLPYQLEWLRNATFANGTHHDVLINGDRVTEIRPAGSAVTGLELAGFMLLSAPAEPHAHLDKAFAAADMPAPLGGLEQAVASWQVYAQEMSIESIADRARRALRAMLVNGTVAVRSHVDLLSGDQPLRSVRALLGVRREFAALMHIELVAMANQHTPEPVIRAALDLGVELVGGAPHLADHPEGFIDRLLAIALEYKAGVDLHTDENLDRPPTLTYYANAVRDWPAGSSLSAGHCVRLGTLSSTELEAIIDAVVASDIGIITLPITNLYLQGWQHPVATPRGLTALKPLLARGVRLGAGADNVQDPFNPVGRSDALETASLLVTAGHLSLQQAYHLVSDGAREVMRLPVAGPIVGARADLLAIKATNLADVIATAAPDRYVIYAGRLVSYSRLTQHSANAGEAQL